MIALLMWEEEKLMERCQPRRSPQQTGHGEGGEEIDNPPLLS